MALKEKSIELLNKGVAKEIQTVLQYIYFQAHFEDKGYTHLSKLFRKIAITEMEHIHMFADRIMFLRGDVIMKPGGDITYLQKKDDKIDVDIKNVLAISAKMESDTVDLYNDYAAQCSAAGDSTSKRLFERLVQIEEEHQDTFDIEGDNYERFGETYLALQTIQRVDKKEEGGYVDVGME